MRPLSHIFSKSARVSDVQPSLRLSEFFDDKYIAFARTTKRRSDLDQYAFDRHMRAQLGNKYLSDITSEDIDQWIMQQVADGYKPATVNKHSSMLRRVLNIAMHWGYLDHNVFKNTAIRKLPVGDHVQRFLNEAEIKRLLYACQHSTHPYLYLFVKLLLLTGARKSELRLARWQDIDTSKRELFVEVSKSGRSRTVMLSNAAITVLQQVRDKADALGLAVGNDAYLFTNPRTNKPYTSFHLAFFEARKQAGLDSVRIHDLRHTYASLLINNGASIYEVQQLLGHYHISMTERYAHLFPSTLQDRVDIIAGKIDLDRI